MTSGPSDDRRALTFGLVTVGLWSTVATAFKLALVHLSAVELLMWASATSCGVLAVIVTVQGDWPKLRAFSRADWARSAAYGALNPALYYLVLFEAYDRLPAQEAQALNYTWALTLAFLSVPFLKRALRVKDVAAGGICYFGALVIATRGAPFSLEWAAPTGVALALGSTLIWAVYWIVNTRDPRPPVVGQMTSFGLGWVIVTAYAGLQGEIRMPPIEGLLGAMYVGVFEMGVAFVLWLKAMKLASNTAKISNLIFISPVVSLGLIAVVLDEPILPSTLGGLGLILVGLAVQRG